MSFAPTRAGEISLRRRTEPRTDTVVYEVKLGEEVLMSSMFTIAEKALADLAIQRARSLRHTLTAGVATTAAEPLTVLVGGLGLGYTAVAALRHGDVGGVDVIEALSPVISWHQQRLLPVSEELLGDDRTRLLLADFFSVIGGQPIDDVSVLPAYDVIALDIDHAPDFVLHPEHESFYSEDGLRGVAGRLSPLGVFGLWSDRAPDEAFMATARSVFDVVEAEVVGFDNALTGGRSSNTVYLAHSRSAQAPTQGSG
ncbi:MAG: spermidine synthase [Ornithinimicrobium sp.]